MIHRRTVSFISLGCPKNLVDSEQLVSTLLSRGFRVVQEPREAELVVVNTCGFLAASRDESVQTIRDAVALKEQGTVRGVLVAGCMVGNYRDQLEREAPGVDRYVPFIDYRRIDELAQAILPEAAPPNFTVERRRLDVSLTPRHFGYLKISEGCNHTCSFCVIPSIRGPMHSVALDDLVAKAQQMGERGVREVSLIAQDSTSYGADIYGRVRLPELLQRLDDVSSVDWFRLMYAYPTEVREPLVDVLASGTRLLPYLDVPIQHAADGVLTRMRRGYGRRDLDTMITLLRSRVHNVALRTTVIVGFPGETESDFQELLDFVQAARFDRLGVFRYSREPSSRADQLDGQVPEEIKDERFHRLMSVQQHIAFTENEAFLGRTLDVLVDSPAINDRPAFGRSFRDAPEVDPGILIEGGPVEAGDRVRVEVVGANAYDLVGRVLPKT